MLIVRKLQIIILVLSFQGAVAQEVIRTMFYNLFEYPSAPVANRTEILYDILQTWAPDIFMVCELESQAGADDILENVLNADNTLYERGPFYFNQSSNNHELQQIIFFRADKFELDTTEIIQTSVRDINHYRLKLLDDMHETSPVYLELYVAHLKSSTGTANEQVRLQMAEAFTTTLSDLDADSYVLFAGDLNLYSSSEPAYQELLSTENAITLADPLGASGSWHGDDSFAWLHTQSTRLSTDGFGGGAGGGLDDRFDFILVSENLMDEGNAEMHYVEDSYQAYGNNGNCFENRIDDEGCGGDYSQGLRSRLYQMSDHLPVVMELQTDRQILSTGVPEFISTISFPQGNIPEYTLIVRVDKTLVPVSFGIYDIAGRQVKYVAGHSSGYHSVDVSSLSEGLYYLVPEGILAKPEKFMVSRN